ncbi:cysteine desulfurase [Adlercreutzia equolifaciens]|uniref:aminotransferase class V-fold PLP-dependent enzyme n=1 Tax=Adlercreutzia equolifaciens TaxID=446660 RepID=UPI0023B1843B|nr:cysteine desulfurase [Adlercreutzia equolifaciens]MDE8702993.1 cysteine desulfurase [Adlercreutzia equolifaciens]
MDNGSRPFDRARYPILKRRVGVHGGRPLIYLDSAATALVSQPVIDAQVRFLQTSCANIHRGAHQLAEEATDAFERTREQLATFFGVVEPERVVLTHGATESLNLAARGWAEGSLCEGDLIVIAADNHHSNIVPWQMLAERKGLSVAWIPLTEEGLLDEDAWARLLVRAPKLVALCQQSNVLGFRQPSLARIAAEAREAGAVVVMDGAQSAGHEPVDFEELGVDFYAMSAHKMGGLTGVGALLCSSRVMEDLRPVYGGGGMAARVDASGWRAAPGPEAFEAGTPPIAAAVAWSAAIDQLKAAGLEAVAAHTRALAERARAGLSALPGVSVLGHRVPRPFESLVSFTVGEVHPHDVGQALDAAGVMVRAGHHCARPVHQACGARASVRASFAGYSTEEEVEALVSAVAQLSAAVRA